MTGEAASCRGAGRFPWSCSEDHRDPPIAVGYVAVLCGGESFSPDDAYDSALDSVMPVKGKYTINYLQYQGVRCVAMSCGGYSFSPYGAYDFSWDSVKP